MLRSRLPVVMVGALALSCGRDSSLLTGPTAANQCTTLGQCSYVRDVLQSFYYWYRQLPDPDPASFSSPEAYLEAVRYRPLDTTFSYVTSKASSDAFYSESQYIGFGFSFKQTGETELRLAQTFPGSPAAEAGMDRGDFLLSVNGKPVPDLIRSGEIGTVFGPEQVGVSADVAWRDMRGQERSATLTKSLVTIPTVSQTAVIPEGSARVGYVHLRNFVQPSVEALSTAFAEVRDGGATDLVLDLRYNGGGLVTVSQHLASLVGGAPLVGKVFVQFTHNDKQASRNTTYDFQAKPQALGLSRLVVIATGSSASASEAVINGLRPYMDVKVVGDATYGKPVGQYGFEFCQKVLYPVSFLVTNARGEADYFDGIPADCAAADDLDHPLADAGEASLAEALHVLRTGRCSAAAAGQARALARLRAAVPPIRVDGWRQTINAW